MGTNFYAKPTDYQILDFISPKEITLHLGKSSAGWKFLFQGDPKVTLEFSIKSVGQWADFIKRANLKIVDEYGKEYTWDEFMEYVNYDDNHESSNIEIDDDVKWDNKGYEFVFIDFS